VPLEEVNNCDELKAAIGKADGETEQRYLVKRAIDLGCVDDIPDEWTVEVRTDG
jgi:hypothetical protein